jgi:hypothetical protein
MDAGWGWAANQRDTHDRLRRRRAWLEKIPSFAHAYQAQVGHAPGSGTNLISNCLILLALPRGLEPLFSP